MNDMIRISAPAPKPQDDPLTCPDAERRKRALEQLRRNLKSALKQTEDLLEMDGRHERRAA